jgi:hypothetical protein
MTEKGGQSEAFPPRHSDIFAPLIARHARQQAGSQFTSTDDIGACAS